MRRIVAISSVLTVLLFLAACQKWKVNFLGKIDYEGTIIETGQLVELSRCMVYQTDSSRKTDLVRNDGHETFFVMGPGAKMLVTRVAYYPPDYVPGIWLEIQTPGNINACGKKMHRIFMFHPIWPDSLMRIRCWFIPKNFSK